MKLAADQALADGRIQELAGEIERVRAERTRVASQRDDAIRRQVELAGKLDRLERDRERFRGKLADWLESELAGLQKRRDALVATLGNRGTEPIEALATRLAETEGELAALTARLQAAAHLAITEIRPCLPEEDLLDLFTLLNPELLGTPLNRPGDPLRAPSPADTARRLRELLSSREGRTVRLAGAEVDLDGLRPPDLGDYYDPHTMQLRIASLAGLAERDRRILEAALEQERLEAEQAALDGDIGRLQGELHDLEAHERDLSLEDGWRKGLAQADRDLAEADRRLEDLMKQEAEKLERSQRLRGELEDKDKEFANLQVRVRGLEPPEATWPAGESTTLPRDLDDLIARYARLGRDHRQEAQAVAEGLARIEQRTYSRYRRATEEETLAILTEESQSIPRKETAVEELWKSLAVGIKSDLTGLGKDLETLSSLVAQVNRQMPEAAISNLRSLRLIIEPVTSWRILIGAIADTEKAPLFGDLEAAGKALKQVGRILAEHPAIELADMFNLHFEVEMPDGERRKYHHLDQFESNGTTIAVKVLVNLILLKRLLADAKVRIPFYLDECSSLDRDNLRAIVDTARELGFTAILASPEAMDVADRIYFMAEEENGRVILDPETALVEIERTLGDGR